MKSSSIVQSLLTPKNGFSVYDHSSNTSSSPSLRGIMNSTTSTNNTVYTESRNIQMNSKVFMEPMNYDCDSKNRARDYHETFNNEISTISKSKTKTDNLLRDSLSQRRNFVHEIEGRLKGLRGDKATPTFKNVSKEDIKSFNFDNELERLKRTLHDIKDQECRFIEILSRKSPDKLQRQVTMNQNRTMDAKKSIELLYHHQDPSVESMSTSNYRNEYKNTSKPNNNISDDLSRFTHKVDNEMNSHVLREKEVQLSEIDNSDSLYDRPSNGKNLLNTPILTNKGTKKRKSSLKKRTQVDKYEYNSGSSTSMKSNQDKKRVRFDNNSIKYKYDVDGIIDASQYKIDEVESTYKNSK
jgi:hypothetical protein